MSALNDNNFTMIIMWPNQNEHSSMAWLCI
jgi:hypothetical protein